MSSLPAFSALSSLNFSLAFIPLTHSVFWGTLAYTLIGGTLGGTLITLFFLPAMYAIWFRIRLPGSKTAVVKPALSE